MICGTGIATVRPWRTLLALRACCAFCVCPFGAEPTNFPNKCFVPPCHRALPHITEDNLPPSGMQLDLHPLPIELFSRVETVCKGRLEQRLQLARPQACVVAHEHLETSGVRAEARSSEVGAVNTAAVGLATGTQPWLCTHDGKVGWTLRSPPMLIAVETVVAVGAIYTLELAVSARVAIKPGAILHRHWVRISRDPELEPHFPLLHKPKTDADL
mmetsp:Transcript_64085/g.133620  ORF Transcript_64085/g.133620 Transcript_64085/m.133620 type:complete len:215 (-) Transcript_64085:819-1463(-)